MEYCNKCSSYYVSGNCNCINCIDLGNQSPVTVGGIQMGGIEKGKKESNPKDAIGSAKLPMHLVPGSAKAFLTLGFLEGALKYGKYNWRVAGVRVSTYLDAMERHMEKYKNGEDCDPVTKVPHLASIMACCSIILDAGVVNKLTDDRPPRAPVSELIDSMVSDVAYLKSLYEGENPHQCTIEDSQWSGEHEEGNNTVGS